MGWGSLIRVKWKDFLGIRVRLWQLLEFRLGLIDQRVHRFVELRFMAEIPVRFLEQHAISLVAEAFHRFSQVADLYIGAPQDLLLLADGCHSLLINIGQ